MSRGKDGGEGETGIVCGTIEDLTTENIDTPYKEVRLWKTPPGTCVVPESEGGCVDGTIRRETLPRLTKGWRKIPT